MVMSLHFAVGALVSTTITTCTQLLEMFPHESYARHVRVAVYAPPQVTLVIVLTTAMFVALPQLSVAVGVPKLHATPHSLAALAGQLVKYGAVVSTTVIV